VCRYGVFKVQRAEAPKRKPPRRTVSQNSAAIVCVEVNIILGDLVVRTNQLTDSSTSQEPPE